MLPVVFKHSGTDVTSRKEGKQEGSQEVNELPALREKTLVILLFSPKYLLLATAKRTVSLIDHQLTHHGISYSGVENHPKIPRSQ